MIDRELGINGTAHRVNTISACCEEKSVDERPFIDAVVDVKQTNAHYVFPRVEDVMASAEQITWHQDEPYGSTSIFAQWSVFQRAGQEKIKVMLDGQGADEQLAGYHGSFSYYFASLLRHHRSLALLLAMFERRRYHGLSVLQQVQTFVVPAMPAPLRTLLARNSIIVVQRDWLQSDAFRDGDFPASTFHAALEREGLGQIQDVGDLCVLLTQATNLPMLLHYEDRNSMAHSVEARVPFLDHRVVEFSIGLGERHKIVGGDTKRVLRRAMSGIMPEKILSPA